MNENIDAMRTLAERLDSLSYAFEHVYMPLELTIPDREMAGHMVAAFYTMRDMITELVELMNKNGKS